MNVENMTIGQFLGSAEAALKKNGGLCAIVDCTNLTVCLQRTSSKGVISTISQAPLGMSEAGEDAASRLLEAHAEAADPAELRFAREAYFPITFV